MKKATKIWMILLASSLILSVLASTVYLAPASVENLGDSLADSLLVKVVRNGDGITFLPMGRSDTGFIFYGGARVSPAAYAPILRPVAEAGAVVFVPQLPFNFAIFEIGRAKRIIKANPDINRWFIGGHSLGGTSGAMFVDKNRDAITGIAFLASYPGGKTDLSTWVGKALSIYASADGLATPEKVTQAKPLLPPDTVYIELHGGNHAGFGRYGTQKGDGEASIPKANQETEISRALVDFIFQKTEGSSCCP